MHGKKNQKMTINSKDIKNLKQKNILEPNVWKVNKGGDGFVLERNMRINLLKMSWDFYAELKIPREALLDIRLTGSLANYSWSKYSDIDLHLVIDFDKINAEHDLMESYFAAKKNLWNKIHDIEMYGYDVEIYIENIDEKHHSTGVYSVLNNSWLVEPQTIKIDFIDFEHLKNKANDFAEMIERIIINPCKNQNNNNIETKKNIEKLIEKLKRLRKSGLERDGEYSYENLVYKLLRRKGYLDKIRDIKIKLYEKELELKI
jgi:6-pyruvoyl-tetrahydropterin synthase